jgi:UPF0176 protein
MRQTCCNVATYKFIAISQEELPELCSRLKKIGQEHGVKGTIILSTEGINLFLAGSKISIDAFQQQLAAYPYLKDLPYKYSYSSFVPYKKLVVKIKQEIVTFKQKDISPSDSCAPYISPHELRSRLQSDQEIILLDARNTFEYQMGTFQSAIHLEIDNFRDFPKTIPKLDKTKPVVTFCTGGIRCEKAAIYLLKQGFKEVYQLQGGILNYFEQCGDHFFEGNCFVFDDRIALNSQLEPIIPIQKEESGEKE